MRPDATLAEKRAPGALRREEIAYIGRELLQLLHCLERKNDIYWEGGCGLRPDAGWGKRTSRPARAVG
jgi:hypothetical protein